VLTAGLGALGKQDTVRPSALDFIARNELGGTGNILLSTADAVADRASRLTGGPGIEARSPGEASNIPVIGGLVGRVVRGQGGQELETARQNTLTDSANRALQQAGVNYRPSAVTNQIEGIPLKQDEQRYFQQQANRLTDNEIQKLIRSSRWEKLSRDEKETEIRRAVDDARADAADATLKTIPGSEQRRRMREEANKP